MKLSEADAAAMAARLEAAVSANVEPLDIVVSDPPAELASLFPIRFRLDHFDNQARIEDAWNVGPEAQSPQQSDASAVELLESAFTQLKSTRLRAIVADVLFWATKKSEYRQGVCAAYVEHLKTVSPDAEYESLQLLRRALRLADKLDRTEERDWLERHAQGLCVNGLPAAVLAAVIFDPTKVPSWFDAEIEKCIAELECAQTPPAAYGWYEMLRRIAVARANANDPTGQKRRNVEQRIGEWLVKWARDTQWPGYLRSEWARRGGELLADHPQLQISAHTLHGTIDPGDGIDMITFRTQYPPEFVNPYRGAVEHVMSSLVTWDEQFRAISALFSIFYELPEIEKFRIEDVWTHHSIGTVERVSSGVDGNRAARYSGAVNRRVCDDVLLAVAPLVRRVIDVLPASVGSLSEYFDDLTCERLRHAAKLSSFGDFDTAVHLAVPLVERVCKAVNRTVGIRPIVPAPSSGGESRGGSLGAHVEALCRALPNGDAARVGLMFSLTRTVSTTVNDEQVSLDGLNVRNDPAHGEGDELFGAAHFAIVIACLSLLARVHQTSAGSIALRATVLDTNSGGK